jgi:predicted Zn-dependent protease
MWQTPSKMELAAAGTDQGLITKPAVPVSHSTPNVQISWGPHGAGKLQTSQMDKIAGLREILALDAKYSFARYGLAIELASRGETAEALEEFDTLLKNDADYTAGYFMAAQTLAKVGRSAEAAERLKAGIACAARCGNHHALSEMQAMLDELGE